MNRREFFIKSAVAGIASTAVTNSWATSYVPHARNQVLVPIGLDAHAVRGMKWNADQLLAYTKELDLDYLLLNGLQYFQSLENGYLETYRKKLKSNGIELYFGIGGLSVNSTSYKPEQGTPKALILQGIRLAKIFGGSSVNCRIGSISDRYTDGGIIARMEEISQALRSMRSQIQDAGIRFAIENHAGDMRSEELRSLVESTGTDICGVMLDPGNAVWAMENPMNQMELLGKHVLCTSIRDYRIWESEEGATFQWTAIGEGSMDFKKYTQRMTELCPEVPLFIETISGGARPIPFLQDDYWEGYPDLKGIQLLDFMKLLRKGEPAEADKVPEGVDKKLYVQEQQKKELMKSISYLQTNCPVVKGFEG